MQADVHNQGKIINFQRKMAPKKRKVKILEIGTPVLTQIPVTKFGHFSTGRIDTSEIKFVHFVDQSSFPPMYILRDQSGNILDGR